MRKPTKSRAAQLRKTLKVTTKEKNRIIKGIEVWVPIPGYPWYEVSSYGRVKVLEHAISVPRKGSTYIRTIKEKIYNTTTPSGRYHSVRVMKEGEPNRNLYVHQLMILAFYKVQTNYYVHAEHINAKKLDNHIFNLEVISAGENQRRFLSRKGTKSGNVGVYQTESGKFKTGYYVGENRVHIGTFETSMQASMAFQKAVEKREASLYKQIKQAS